MPNIASSNAATLSPPFPGLVAVDGRTFPLRAARLNARAQGGLAATTLIQEFANPHAEPLEVLYTLPLPADGAVVGYTFRLGDRVVTGRIERREAAAAAYRRALEAGKTAGLLEQDRADTFTQTLGNLPPGSTVSVEIDVLHPLAFDRPAAGPARWEWRFPTVVGVRYEGAPGRVPDAERLDTPRADAAGTPVTLEATVHLGDGVPATLDPRSPSHAIRIADGGAATCVTLADPTKLDRDLVVRWTATSASTEARLTVGRGLPGDDGRYALVTVTPPTSPAAVFARDLTILLDASGSMGGPPIETAKEVAINLLASLDPADRFEILAFANRVRPLTRGLVSATAKAVAEATAALRRLDADGGTEMLSALDEALAPLRADAQRQVVLVTDGYIGFESEVVGRILERLPEASRLHVVGIGAAPNRALSHAAARAGRGIEMLIGTQGEAREGAQRLARSTARPILTGVAVSGSGMKLSAVSRPRDVFEGEPLTIPIELTSGGGLIEVRGTLAGSSEPWVRRFTAAVEVASESALPLGAYFGRERVEEVEMLQAASGRANAGFDREIEAIGLRHRIVTRRTSLVAVSEDLTVDPADPRRRQRLAVELPHGVSAEGAGLAAGAAPSVRLAYLSPADTEFKGLVSESEFLSPRLMDGFGRPRTLVSVARRDAASDRVGPAVLTARLVRVDGDTVLFELEVPEGGGEVPIEGHEATLVAGDGSTQVVRFVAGRGTKPGFVEAGLTIRLAVATVGATPVPATCTALRWTDAAGMGVTIVFTH